MQREFEQKQQIFPFFPNLCVLVFVIAIKGCKESSLDVSDEERNPAVWMYIEPTTLNNNLNVMHLWQEAELTEKLYSKSVEI